MYPSTTIAVPKQEIKEAASLVFVKLAPNNGVQKEITFTRRITYNSSFSSKRMIFHRYLEHATNVKKKLSITSDAIDHGVTEPLYFPLDLFPKIQKTKYSNWPLQTSFLKTSLN
jgi:hypothetical protein